MSLKNPKHLLIIGAVVVALMVGTVLLASYTNILPGNSDADSQVKTCQAKNSTPHSGANPVFAENANVECARKAEAESDAKVCPFRRTEPHSEEPCPSESTKPECEEATTDCCGNPCLSEGTKPE